MTQALYFLKGSSGYIKIGRSTNFPKRLSEIRRGTTDEYINVLAVFYSDAETIAESPKARHRSSACCAKLKQVQNALLLSEFSGRGRAFLCPLTEHTNPVSAITPLLAEFLSGLRFNKAVGTD
jgi:T5orf172 domain-containing protein